MSYSLDPLRTSLVLDPRISLYAERQYSILKGARQISWQQITAQSANSVSQLVFNAPPPNANIIVDSHFLVRAFVQGTFAGTAASGSTVLLELGTNDGFRQFPLNSCINVAQLTLNNGAFSVNTSEVLPALLTCGFMPDMLYKGFSTAPSMPDSYQRYGDWSVYGSGRNPLALFGENPCSIARGGFPYTVSSNTSSAASIQAVLTEPMFISPLKWNKLLQSGFSGLTNVTLTLTMNSLSRMWCHAVGSTFSSDPAFTFYANPQMLFQYLTAPMSPAIPRSIPYPYTKVSYTVSPGASLAPGASTTIVCSNQQLGTIPRAIVMFAAIRQSSRTYLTSDSFAAITNINVQWNGQAGLLSAATQQDLYRLAVQGGCTLSWPEWSTYRGSVLPLLPGMAWGLDSIEAPGLAGSYQFQPTVSIQNMNSTDTLTFDLYSVVLEDGIATIAEQNCQSQTGIVSPLDIVNGKESPMVDYPDEQMIFGGGSFFGTLRNVLGSIVSGVRTALPYVQKALPYAEKFLGVGSNKRPRTEEFTPDQKLRMYTAQNSIGLDRNLAAAQAVTSAQVASAVAHSQAAVNQAAQGNGSGSAAAELAHALSGGAAAAAAADQSDSDGDMSEDEDNAPRLISRSKLR